MEFTVEKLPEEETLVKNCTGEGDGYTGFGFIRVQPSGCILPAIYEHSIEVIRNFPVRQEDLYLISNPKCGTTWCMEMVWIIANDLNFEKAKSVPQLDRFPHIDFQGCLGDTWLSQIAGGNYLNFVESQPSPRFIKTHLPKVLLPTNIWETKCKGHSMEFTVEKLPKEETLVKHCADEVDPYTGFGFIQVQPSGCILPANYEHSIQVIRNFPVRPEDLYLISNPKCGTTWCMEMVWVIANDLNFEMAKSIPQLDRFPHIDLQGCLRNLNSPLFKGGNYLKFVESQPSPRFIKTHLPKVLLPTNIWENKCKIVFIARDIKDAAISNYHHYVTFHTYKGTLEQFLEAVLEEKVMYAPFWEHIIEFWNMRNEPNVLFLTYEEMKRDLDAVITRTATFLGKTLSPEQINQVKDHISLGSMKKNPMVNYDDVKKTIEKVRPMEKVEFIREGQAGGWAKVMTPEMAARFDEFTKKKIQGTGLEAIYGAKNV